MNRIRVWAALLLVLCLLTGCGGGDEETTPPTETTTQPAETTIPPTTEPPTQPETEPPVDVEAAYWAVIEGICPIVTESGDSTTLTRYLLNGYGAYPASCALVDFDKDGNNEMVISTTSQEASYIVLHYSDGDVFAFSFGFRSMECLKTDGTFITSSSAYETSYCHLRFNGGRCIVVTDAEEDSSTGSYRLNGEVSSKEAVADFSKRWYSKPDAHWTYLDMVPEEPTEPAFQPYIQSIPGNQSVYSGPGYDYGFVMSIGTPGRYTIVEEAWDYEGNLWGKLKSGAGWINLTAARAENQNPPLLTANFANNSEYGTDDYYYITDFSEYAVPILFRAGQDLHFVNFYAVDYDYDGLPQLRHLYSHGYMEAGVPVVIVASFPGDMSTYAITFEDSQGREYCYGIYISGRNGALVMSPLDI